MDWYCFQTDHLHKYCCIRLTAAVELRLSQSDCGIDAARFVLVIGELFSWRYNESGEDAYRVAATLAEFTLLGEEKTGSGPRHQQTAVWHFLSVWDVCSALVPGVRASAPAPLGFICAGCRPRTVTSLMTPFCTVAQSRGSVQRVFLLPVSLQPEFGTPESTNWQLDGSPTVE